MVCKAKVNSLQYLKDKNLINDVRKILDEPAFDRMNQELTRYAEVKYGLPTEGELLYSKQVVGQSDPQRSAYWRDAKYTITFAVPNDALFNALDKLKDNFDSRNLADLPEETLKDQTAPTFELKFISAYGENGYNLDIYYDNNKVGSLNYTLVGNRASVDAVEIFDEYRQQGFATRAYRILADSLSKQDIVLESGELNDNSRALWKSLVKNGEAKEVAKDTYQYIVPSAESIIKEGKQFFDKELAQKIQDKLQQLYPEIKLNITNNPVWEQGDNIFNQEEFNNQVSYRLKSVEILSSDKAKQVFRKGEKSGWDLNKILTELQISKAQKELILSLGKTKLDDIVTDLLANYSYAVEINTAKNKSRIDFYEGIQEVFDEPIPTEYYSNLTVPGGTNYTEQEIATPGITPSIKGHAQFATDQGIGWFRSDDKSIEDYKSNAKNIEELEKDLNRFQTTPIRQGKNGNWYIGMQGPFKTESEAKAFKEDRLNKTLSILNSAFKTRRILEVQSDLFQKGRGKEDLISKIDTDSYSRGEDWIEFNGKEWEAHNSIIGILQIFPTREEAAEFLGITVGVTEDPQKGNQFLQLLSKDNNWVNFFVKSIIQDSAKKGYEKVLFPSGNTASKVEGHTTLEEFKKQKEDRIKELEEENTVYLRDNEYENQIRSDNEYEIKRLKEELKRLETEGFAALRPIYNFYENTVANVLKKQGYNPKQITDEYKNTWNEVTINQAKDLQNILLQRDEANNIIGQANIKAVTVLIDVINQKQDTLPHEYAHHYIAWFRDTPIVQEAIKKWGSEEALVQSIGEQVVKQKGEAYTWWNKFVKWILNQFNSLSKLQKEELTQILTDAFLTRQDLGTKQDIEGFKEFVNKEKETIITPTEEFDPIKAVETIELNVPEIQKARAKEMLDVISERLALGLQVSYQNITPQEATEILKDRPIPYTGQPGFYHAGVIYTVGDNVSLSTALHEFSHPLLGALRRENKTLFNNLYNTLVASQEGEAIENYVRKKYPELLDGGDLFKEEVLAYALQLKSLTKINEQVASKGFDRFIALMMKAIKDMLKKIFGSKAVVSKLNVDTTLEELADMLLTKEFEYDTVMASEEDIIMYLKSVNEVADNLAENVSVKALQDGINRLYVVSDAMMKRAKNFKKGTPEYEMLQQSIFMDINKNKLLPAVKSSLAPFQDFTRTSKQSRDQIINDAIDAEEKRLKDITLRATSFVNGLGVMNESAKYMFDNILAIQEKSGFVSRPAIALLSMYKVNNRAIAETVMNLDDIFRKDFGLGPGNPLYTLMGELTQNVVRNEELIKDVYMKNTGKFYVEITGDMNQFVTEQFKTNLNTALAKKMTEPEIEVLYNKVITQTLTDEDLEALSKIKGVNMRYVNRFIDDYNYFITNEDKILDILRGNTQDISVISRFLESYSTSNDPIIGSLAVWINDKKGEAEQTAIKKAHGLRAKLETLLPKVNFNPNKTDQIFNMIASEDEVFDIDKETRKPIRRKVGTLLNEFGNGWRHDLSELEYNLEEAKEAGDKKQIEKAQNELDTFISDYMWQKYLPEVYEQDKIFDEHPIGRQAWLERKMIIEEMQGAINPVANELERFEKYSVMQALWKEYNQLYSFTYLDGSPKVDSPEDGIFDLTKAKILRKHREATRDYHEFVPIEGSLQTAYNNFVLLIQAEDIERGSEEFEDKLAEWERQNIRRAYSPEYYEAVAKNIKRLKELQSKINQAMASKFDVGAAYEELYDIKLAFKDEQGQPVPQELGAERLKKIRDIDQQIIDFKSQFDKKKGLTIDEAKELDFIKQAMKKGVALTDEQKIRYAKLSSQQEMYGLTPSEIEEINDIYSELSDLRSTIPTEYYMDIMNARFAEMDVPAVSEVDIDKFINSTEFAGILASDDNFANWFYDNHVTRKVYKSDIKKNVIEFQRSSAYSISVPKNPDYYIKTTIVDRETGEEVTFTGIPNARHSIYKVKDKYRTIPYEDDYSKYIGVYVDNKGNYLPRLYKPGDKYSAKTDKYMNRKFFDLKAKGGPEFELLNAVKEYFLDIQKGKAGNSKLYLDIPRYSIKDRLEFIQSGLLQEKYDDFKGSLKYYFDRTFTKAADDNERGYNYNAENNLVNTDLNGTELGFVPVTGLYRLDFDVTSKDVFSSLFQHAMSLETQAVLIETLPLVQSILDTVEDPANAPKINGISKQILKLKGEKRKPSSRDKKSQRAAQLRSLVEREYYGRKVVGLDESNIILSKVLNGLQRLSATSTLALNPSSDLKNRYGAIAQNIVEAAGGEFVDLKSLAMGRIAAAKAMLDWSAKGIYAKGRQSLSTQLIMAFDPVFRTEEAFGKKTSVTRSMAKDLLNGSFLYDFRKFAEMEGALQLFFGFMDKKQIEIKLKDGKTAKIKYADAWELDNEGYIKLKDGIDPEYSNQSIYHTYIEGETLDAIAKRYYTTKENLLKKNKLEEGQEITPGTELTIATSDKFKRFRNQFAGTSHLLYGAYDAFAQPEGDQYMLYRMFFFMRKWATPMFVNKWGASIDTSEGVLKAKVREKYNWELGRTRMGYYTKTLQTIYELARSRGDKYNHMTEPEKIALKKTFADTMQMIIYALLVAMIFGYDSDDKERWEKLKAKSGPYGTPEFEAYGFLANHTMLLLLGVQAETSAFLPLPKIGAVQFGLDDYSKFLTQTSSAFGNTVILYAKIMQDIFNTLLSDESAYYKREAGPYWWQEKEANKIWGHVFKTIGFTGGTGDPITLIKNLENSGVKI